jgi:hypothetical protein
MGTLDAFGVPLLSALGLATPMATNPSWCVLRSPCPPPRWPP